MKKNWNHSIFCFIIFSLFFSTSVFAVDQGDETIQLGPTGKKTKPPVIFPHKTHQDLYECGDCHHGMADGKQTAYTENLVIQKCESCHNKETMDGVKKGKAKLWVFKDAAHENCRSCHYDEAKKDSEKKHLKSCKTCHKKMDS